MLFSSREVAYHEAGHACVIETYRPYYEGVAIKIVRVTDDDPCVISVGQRRLPPLQRMTISLAGYIAEKRATGAAPWGSAIDFRKAAEIADAAGDGDRLEVNRLRRAALSNTIRLVDAHWWQIENLAGVLMARGQLSGSDVRYIVDATLSAPLGRRRDFLGDGERRRAPR